VQDADLSITGPGKSQSADNDHDKNLDHPTRGEP
jgi:hypothetical protein